MCNPTGNNMKRCGGGSNPAFWWYNPKHHTVGDAIIVTLITLNTILANVEIVKIIGDVLIVIWM